MKINNGQDYKHILADEGYPVFGSGGPFAFASQFIYDGEVVMLGRKGTIDKPLYYKGKFWTVDTMFYAIPKKRSVCRFMYYLARTFPFSYYSTATALPSMTQFDLGNNPVALPPLPEQQAIASFLDAKMKPIDEIIAKRERQIELLEEMKSGIISRAVTKGLNSDAKMKDSGIEGVDVIPEHWNKTRFVYSSWIRSRLGWRALKADEYKDSGYPFLSAYNIVDNKLVWDDFNYISQERFDESPEIKLNIGDILLVKDGAGLGKCARVDELPEGPSTVNGSLAVITPHEGLSYNYLYYYLLGNTFKQMIDLLRNGMGVPHFTQGNMRTIYLPLPPLGEQEQIVTYLDSTIVKLDVRIAKRRKQIELLQEYEQALITAAVTGKIDVREHVS